MKLSEIASLIFTENKYMKYMIYCIISIMESFLFVIAEK